MKNIHISSSVFFTFLVFFFTIPAFGQPVCGKYCDGRARSLAASQRVGATTNITGRILALDFDDDDNMAWATLAGGKRGDQVILSRSFDEGTTWQSVGRTVIMGNGTLNYTKLYTIDSLSEAHRGKVKACAFIPSENVSTCTAAVQSLWPWNRSTWATTLLMNTYYDNNPANLGWWTGANALTATINKAKYSGMPVFEKAIDTIYTSEIYEANGNFTNNFLDDTGWWGLAWVAAYDLTGNNRYLETAEADADHMTEYWDNSCNGGVWWNTDKHYKNAITNELYLQLTAALHNRIPNDTKYRSEALQEWKWFLSSGMINSQNLINDGLIMKNETTPQVCTNNGQPEYTYNQGVILGGIAELSTFDKDSSVISTGTTLANASTTSTDLNTDGILGKREAGTCSGDGSVFNGAYIRGLDKFNRVLMAHPYSNYIQQNATAAFETGQDSNGNYGFNWLGPYNGSNEGCQLSAVDLMNAADYPPE